MSREPQHWTVDGDVAHLTLKGRRVLVDAADLHLVTACRWNIDRLGYVHNRQLGLLHRILLGLKVGDPREVDHKHHVPWDNRRSEIRISDRQQNCANMRTNARSKRGRFKGVSFDKARGKYRVDVRGPGKRFLGRYESELDAAMAYDRVAKERYGPFACLNFP